MSHQWPIYQIFVMESVCKGVRVCNGLFGMENEQSMYFQVMVQSGALGDVFLFT